MRKALLTFLTILFFTFDCWTQDTVIRANTRKLDSLLLEFKTKRCSRLESSIKDERTKTRLDQKLVNFLNDFYYQNLSAKNIDKTLRSKFKQSPWRFDQIVKQGGFTRYQGRIRSFGNVEAFIGYVIFDDKVVAKRIYFLTRSRLDCLDPKDYLGLPDVAYLKENLIGNIKFPLDLLEWYNFFFSQVNLNNTLTEQGKETVNHLLSKPSAQ
jgi:hypothetical protein